MSEETPKFKVYEVECGATYYVAALTFRSALTTWFSHYFDVENADDACLDYVHCDLIPLERSKCTMIVIDGGSESGEDKKSTYDLAQEAVSPEVIGCSEW